MDDDDIPILIETSEPESRRIPITLICGFLGAGKSTLLKWILTERHGFRIAVIMNEFGDTADIEGKAISVSGPEGTTGDVPQQTYDEFLELSNGCLCCTIKDSGVAAIEQLMRRKGAFDYILLETTGLADPGPIAAVFWRNEEFAVGLGKDIYLDGVICVVDAVFSEKQIKEDTETEGIKHSLRQIACADVILLNKTDLVNEKELARTESLLGQLNPLVPIHRTVHGKVPLSDVLGINAYGDDSRRLLRHGLHQELLEEGLNAVHDRDHNHDHDHDHAQHNHEDGHVGISNIVVHIPKPLTDPQINRLEEWIRSVLWEGVIPDDDDDDGDLPLNSETGVQDTSGDARPPLEILRCKGIWSNQRGEQFILQGVRNIYDISKYDGGDDQEQQTSGKVVFIGRGLSKHVTDSFMRLLDA